MKRILQLMCSVAFIVMLMGFSLNSTAAKEPAESPSSQVLASVAAPGKNAELVVDTSSTDMAALVSVLCGLGLILVGCGGLFILERS